jgi:DNA anti-recombination protein RmuC
MNKIEDQLQVALTDFMQAVAQKSDKVGSALKRISDLHRQLGPDAHPMLRHYLERRSYQKALDLLNEGKPETDKPQCGH